MGKSAQFEGVTIDGYQQQQCGPRSALEIWRPAAALVPEPEAGAEFSFTAVAAAAAAEMGDWATVSGLEPAQLQALSKVASRGVYWAHPSLDVAAVLTLHHGGDVDADGNCLFTAAQKSLQTDQSPLELRQSAVKRFLEDFEAGSIVHCNAPLSVDRFRRRISGDPHREQVTYGRVQGLPVRLLRQHLHLLDDVDAPPGGEIRGVEVAHYGIDVLLGDEPSWAKYMALAGVFTEEYDIINLQYTEEGLFNVEENREGGAAAFGDDIAIECLASEFQREIFVMQVHGADAMVEDEENLFFLPHTPRGEGSIRHPPAFLLMKGTGWCAAGGHHYEPVLARVSPNQVAKSAARML